MSPLSNSVYSSVFTYNQLTRTYRNITLLALIGAISNHVSFTNNISFSIVGFGDSAQESRMDTLDTPMSCQKRICGPSIKVY